MKKIFTLIAMLLMATTTLMAQLVDIVYMKTTSAYSASLEVQYTASEPFTITANGTHLNNGSPTYGIVPDFDGSIIISATRNVCLTYLDCYGKSLTHLDVANATDLVFLECGANNISQLNVASNTNLEYFYSSINNISVMDVTNNTALIELACSRNNLSEFNVSNNTNLTSLGCHNNNLTELDVANNTLLKSLSIYNNNLTELDVSNNTDLTHLYCYGNPITELDVSNNTKLIRLDCYNTPLTELDVSMCTVMTHLYCYNSQISSLKLSSSITDMGAQSQTVQTFATVGGSTFPCPINYFNGYSPQDVNINGSSYAFNADIPIPTGNTLYFNTYMSINGSPYGGIINLQIINGLQVTFVSNGGSNVAPIIVQPGDFIGAVNCYRFGYTLEGWYTEPAFIHRWNLETDPVTASMTLYAKWETDPTSDFLVMMKTTSTNSISLEVEYIASGNFTISANGVSMNNGSPTYGIVPDANGRIIISTTGNVQLIHLGCNNKSLTELDVTSAIDLIFLDCGNNTLTVLDVANNTKLEHLQASGSRISQLDVTNNRELTYLSCSRSLLTEFNIANNAKLWHFGCHTNYITELDVTNCTNLSELTCFGNNIAELDVTNNTELTYLWCYGNPISELDVSNNTKLIRLDCYNTLLTKLDVSMCTVMTHLYCYNSQISSLKLSNSITDMGAQNQVVRINVMEGATSFPNPLYYHNKTHIEGVMIDGTPYAFNENIPIPYGANSLYFDTYWTINGSPYSGIIHIIYTTGVQITFNSNGGTYIAPIIIEPGSVIGHIQCNRQGYSLAGWFRDDMTFTQRWELETDIVSISMTLHAKWNVKGIDDFNTPPLNIYPNPTSSIVTIEGISKGDIITITDLCGRKVMKIRAQAEIQTIDISNLSAGVYVISTEIGGNAKLVVN